MKVNSVETAKFRNTVSCSLSLLPMDRGRPVAQEDILNLRAYALCHLEAQLTMIMHKKKGRLIISIERTACFFDADWLSYELSQ